MNDYPWKELLVDKAVNYLIEENGELIIVQNVPARVNPETGEQLISPNTVRQLRELVRERKSPSRVVETPVYEFSDQIRRSY
ncbi:MAG: hypothetical protein JSV42_12025 [Chloroflexota bacterium]|nr:MAG: hypothetical protein JSV42_12025 [Chloroflexota bacterium]